MEIRTTGFKELNDALDELTKGVGKGVLRRSLLKAAQPMAELAKGMAPDDPATGGFDLKTSITAGTKLSRAQTKAHRKMFRDDRAAVEVFVGPGPLPQAHLQEFGTVHHAPQPYLRPAFDADAGPLIDRLGAEMSKEVKKAVGRARRKALKG
ncbi:MAG: HK97 gp10 family phage protein [Loktanella sp.]|nr:HK97 gp10 family phage protein [Loktanella sp.]